MGFVFLFYPTCGRQSCKTSIFFAGDTGYTEEIFKTIGEWFTIDVALLPVGPAGGPFYYRWFTWRSHANPGEAMRILKMLDARWTGSEAPLRKCDRRDRM